MSKYNTISVISKREEEIFRLNRRVLEDSPDLIAVVDDKCSFRYVNPAYAAVHGKTPDEFSGRNVREFVGDTVFETIVQPRIATCLSGDDVRYEEWFDFPETGIRYMDVRYLPLRDKGKKIRRFVIILRDMTYMKRAEEARLTEEKLRTVVELAGTYNHEINNPLCSLTGYLELLKQREQDPKRLSFLEKAIGDARRIADVTKKLAETTAVSSVDYPGGGKIMDIGKPKEADE